MSGNYMSENGQLLTPTFKFPIADKLNFHSSHQGRLCGYFEANFFKCMEAFGARLGRLYCDLEHRDYRECVTNEKKAKRIRAIRLEHYKQYLTGQRSTLFEDHVPVGSYHPDYFEHKLHP